MTAHVETIAYRRDGGAPWHGMGIPVKNGMTTDEMIIAAGLDWTVSKRPLYFPKVAADGETELRIVPDEFALIRDSDESVLDTVGKNFEPVQNEDVLGFFKRFVEAGDMQLETAGSLKGGKFIWALARFNSSFKIGKADETRGYILLSQPHQFGFSLTAALTPVRVVCWNTISAALGTSLDGSGGSHGASFRMVHSKRFDDNVKSEAERALGLATAEMTAFSHTAEMLSNVGAKPEVATEYFRDVLKLDKPEDDTEAAAQAAEEDENHNVRRFREAMLTSPGSELSTAKGTFWGAFQGVTYVVDHEMGRSQDNRLFSAWYGHGSTLKKRALELAVTYAKAA